VAPLAHGVPAYPSVAAIIVLGCPRAACSTIRARSAKRCSLVAARTTPVNSRYWVSVNSIRSGLVIDIAGDP
jgi:hypothetical protein